MKKLNLKSPSYNYLLNSYEEWLDILGYAAATVETLPVHVRELLHHLEQKGHSQLHTITNKDIKEFTSYLLTRKSQKSGTGLSSSSINKSIVALNSFSRYLHKSGKFDLAKITRQLEVQVQERTILTKEEIKALYEATYNQRRGAGTRYGQRDRAMLAIFYGCGLRKNEATHLDRKDVQLTQRQIHVRKGKGHKERLVPLTPTNQEYLQSWLEEGRPEFIERTNSSSEALFINDRGQRMNGFYQRLELLSEEAGLEIKPGHHTLRHSIATHLLEAGMDIEDIARFLGHSSLESTQIYTHLINESEHGL